MVPKNDKKKRKQLTEEIAKLEADLNRKHEEELRQLESHTKASNLLGFLPRHCNVGVSTCWGGISAPEDPVGL